ncbi:MAG: hypothetical protein ACK4WJ_02615 [Endomicrobiia bacterium]
MKEIENILQKIDFEVKNKIEEIKNLTEQKKVELETKYNNMFEEQKNFLEKEFEQNLLLSKKRIFAEKFVEYNKKVEEIKNQLFNNLLEKIKKLITNIDKTEYYKMLKNFLLKNLFFNENNYLVFDNSDILKKDEKENLIKEIIQEIYKNYPYTKVYIKEDENEKFSFGIKILSDKKSKEFSLDTIVDLIKPLCEEEINKLIF